jgi:hypothetical protein
MIVQNHLHAVFKSIIMFPFIMTTKHPCSFTLSSIFTSFSQGDGTHPPQAIISLRQIIPFQHRVIHASMKLFRSGKYKSCLTFH